MPNIVRTGGGVGGIKELFDFPLTIENVIPTPADAKAVGHLWIVNDTVRDVYMDEAIRADYDNCYIFVVPDTNNKYQRLQHQKKTTTGDKLLITERSVDRNAKPWPKATNHSFAPNAQFEEYGDYPIVYSKVNGVVDMETAYRWDGTAWQYISQKGSFVFRGSASAYPTVANRIGAIATGWQSVLGDFFTRYAGSVTVDNVKFSNNHTYVAIGAKTGPSVNSNYNYRVYIMKRVGSMFSEVADILISEHETGNPIGYIAWKDNDSHLAVAVTNGATRMALVKNNGDNTFSHVGTDSTIVPTYYKGAIGWHGGYLYTTGSGTYNLVRRLLLSNDTLVPKTDIAMSEAISPFIIKDDTLLCLTGGTATDVSSNQYHPTCYKFNGDLLEQSPYGLDTTHPDTSSISICAKDGICVMGAAGVSFNVFKYDSSARTLVFLYNFAPPVNSLSAYGLKIVDNMLFFAGVPTATGGQHMMAATISETSATYIGVVDADVAGLSFFDVI